MFERIIAALFHRPLVRTRNDTRGTLIGDPVLVGPGPLCPVYTAEKAYGCTAARDHRGPHVAEGITRAVYVWKE